MAKASLLANVSRCESTIKNTEYNLHKFKKTQISSYWGIWNLCPLFLSIFDNFGGNKILKGEVFCGGDLVQQKLI